MAVRTKEGGHEFDTATRDPVAKSACKSGLAVLSRLADFSHIDTPPWGVLNPVS